MKINDFHTRVCAAGDLDIDPLAASVGGGMRANLKTAQLLTDVKEKTNL